jgi:hypothetical protein
MEKRARFFFTVMAAAFLTLPGLCSAQTRSLEDLKAEIRAGVRSEMGLDKPVSYAQPAANQKEGEPSRNSIKSTINMPVDSPLPKYLAVMVLTAAMTVFFMKLFGGAKKQKGKEKSKREENENPEKERPSQSEDRKKSFWGPSEGSSNGSETAIDIYEKIERIQALRNRGVISEEEFSTKKKQLLDRI